MTDKKYTDEQIVRALECCANNEKDNTCQYCRECPASNWELDDEECDCMHSMYTRSISIINRQKAEIEGYRKRSEGEWAPCDVLPADEDGEWTSYACSMCKYTTDSYYRDVHDLSRYCPNCGARMKGGE